MRYHRLSLVLIVPSLMIGSTAAQTNVENPADPYVHEQTGMAFPALVAGARRHQVVRYNVDGSDSGIGYQVARKGKMVAYVSIFIYPAAAGEGNRNKLCKNAMEGIKRDIRSHEPDAKLTSETEEESPSSVFRTKGLHAVFEGGRANFDGLDQKVREDAFLYCDAGRKWLVSYRATSSEGSVSLPAVKELMQAIAWPDTLKR